MNRFLNTAKRGVLGVALAAPVLLNSVPVQAALPGFAEPATGGSGGTVVFTNVVGLELIAAAVLTAGAGILVLCFGVQGTFRLAKKGFGMLFSRI